MIHVIFNEADISLMKEVMAADETLQGEIVYIADDYAVGPINALETLDGRATRLEWWGKVLAGTEIESKLLNNEVDDDSTIARMLTALDDNPEEQVWLWVAHNVHDLSGYYFLLSFLKPYAGRIQILFLNNLPFLNEQGQVFYPHSLGEIPVKEFLKAKKLARAITLSEFETDPDEWTRLAAENRHVRRLEGGKKLVQHDEDHFDAELKKFVSTEFQKTQKIFGQYFTKSKLMTGDAYLLWRLKEMTAAGILESRMVGKKAAEPEFRGMSASPIEQN